MSNRRTHECHICQDIEALKNNKNSSFVHELTTGYVVIGSPQFYKGYVLFLSKKHVGELHELPEDFKKQFLLEMSWVAKAVFQAFKPCKLNYELLGNTTPHLHWHIFPRYLDDAKPKIPVWNNPDFIQSKIVLSDTELITLKTQLQKKLEIILRHEN